MPIECDALCWGFSEFQPTPREHLSRRSAQVFFALDATKVHRELAAGR